MKVFNQYEWLYSINGTANPSRCLVMNELPFMTPSPAIAFVTERFPEIAPKDKPISQNVERCSDIARHSQHEVEYLITQLEGIAEDLKKQAERYDAEADRAVGRDLMTEVGRQVSRQYAQDRRNQAIGVMQAVMRLRSRHTELVSLAGPGQYSDWRI